jgi:hypothetical protein
MAEFIVRSVIARADSAGATNGFLSIQPLEKLRSEPINRLDPRALHPGRPEELMITEVRRRAGALSTTATNAEGLSAR